MMTKTNSPEQTHVFAASLLEQTNPGDVYGLIGTLGSGKTEFVRGFMKAIDPAVQVRSPSFSIVNTYITSRFHVFHFDFYRLNRAEELIEVGFSEYCFGGGVCLIEWADLFPLVLPPGTKTIRFSVESDTDRTISVER